MDRPEVHVLDPDPGSVATIRSLLEEVGLPVTAHADPAELLAGEVLEQRPECVVSELALPGFNGLELQRRLACQRVPAPCIFVTAAATVPRARPARRRCSPRRGG